MYHSIHYPSLTDRKSNLKWLFFKQPAMCCSKLHPHKTSFIPAVQSSFYELPCSPKVSASSSTKSLYKQSQVTALIPGPHNVRLLSTGADYWSPNGVPQEEQQNDDHDDNGCYFSVRGPQIQVAGVLPVFLRNDW